MTLTANGTRGGGSPVLPLLAGALLIAGGLIARRVF
jgi:hypothetical protein